MIWRILYYSIIISVAIIITIISNLRINMAIIS